MTDRRGPQPSGEDRSDLTPAEPMCRCGKNPATALHTCPYSEEINNDSTTLCDCCEECEQECAWDI